MTVPEENRGRTGSTDQMPDGRADAEKPQEQGGTGRTLREALEEAQVRPDDFAEREEK
ncbi:hypothetical protein ACFYP4_21285 [Streptomyces sp. NPDC005551]|uniref:hypothetical protein n=1 Tax=unclassified Streptomyces TaxID=2593676 RepID=UPI00340485A0